MIYIHFLVKKLHHHIILLVSVATTVIPRGGRNRYTCVSKRVQRRNLHNCVATMAEWVEMHDESSGQKYYQNTVTGESSWEKPEGFGAAQNHEKAEATPDKPQRKKLTKEEREAQKAERLKRRAEQLEKKRLRDIEREKIRKMEEEIERKRRAEEARQKGKLEKDRKRWIRFNTRY